MITPQITGTWRTGIYVQYIGVLSQRAKVNDIPLHDIDGEWVKDISIFEAEWLTVRGLAKWVEMGAAGAKYDVVVYTSKQVPERYKKAGG